MINSPLQRRIDHEQRLNEASAKLGMGGAPRFAPAVPPEAEPKPAQMEVAQSKPPPSEPTAAPVQPPPARAEPPIVRASAEALAQLAEEDILLKIGRATLELASPDLIPERSSKEVRRKMPKSRTGSFHNPYPGKKRDTVRTSFSFSMEGRMELERFFVELGPQRRHIWTEQVLLRNARVTLTAMRKNKEQKEIDEEEAG